MGLSLSARWLWRFLPFGETGFGRNSRLSNSPLPYIPLKATRPFTPQALGQYSFISGLSINGVGYPPKTAEFMLVGLSRRDPSGLFQPVPLSFPVQFVWTPLEFTPPVITLIREHILDFGYVEEQGDKFIPRLYATPVNFRRYVGPNEAVRFQLKIEATNFTSPIYAIEVAWDGVWSFVPDEMGHHLPIRFLQN